MEMEMYIWMDTLMEKSIYGWIAKSKNEYKED